MEVSQKSEVVKTKKAKEEAQVDRVILGKSEAKLLSKWMREFNEKADGLVKVSKADMVNYLIASHPSKLSEEEVSDIARRYYDETRWLGWSMTKMKEAKKKGMSLLFADLMKFRDEFLSSSAGFIKKSKTPKPPKDDKRSEALENGSAIEAKQDPSKKPQESVSEA